MRKIIISCLFAFFLGLLASKISFDFDNYLLYADQFDVASERFSNEPIFPVFILLLGLLDIPSDLIVQLFIFLGTFFIVYSLIELANRSGELGTLRSVIAIIFATPFIIFSVIVPRQGLATGFVLLAMTLVIKNNRFVEWKTISLLFLATMTHSPTALLGMILILLGYSNLTKITLPLILLTPIYLLGIEIFHPEIFKQFFIGYEHYVGNMRETGAVRLTLFAVVAIIYLTLISWRVGGYFSESAIRNLAVVFFLSLAVIILYFNVATDAIRLSYIISILMTAEVICRSKFGRTINKATKH